MTIFRLTIFRLTFFIIFITLLSCGNNTSQETNKSYSGEELQFMARFDHNLLNQIARRTISIQRKSVTSGDDIKPIEGKQVAPVVYNQLLSTQYMEQEHKKQLFIAQMLPQILVAKFYLEQQKEVLEILLSEDSVIKGIDLESKQAFIKQQQKKYDAESTGELMDKLTTHPTSIILAQAAIESNWGGARAYSEANNPFQILSGDSAEARLKTLSDDGAVIYLRKYEDLPASTVDYFRKINRTDRLAPFRRNRQNNRDPLKLIQFLDEYDTQYSEKYSQALSDIIQNNNLRRYDTFEIDSTYINNLTREEIRGIIEAQTEREKNIVTTDAERIKKIQSKSVDIQYKKITDAESIIDVESKYVVPNVYTNVIDLKYLPLKERKEKFINMLLPSVLTASYGIQQTRERISSIQESKAQNKTVSTEDSIFLEKQLKAWKAKDIEQLLEEKLITRPNSIMLAQAALETGWGSSRFFIVANNTFGVWSFNSNESRIRALGTRNGTPIYVKKYGNLSASIIDYYKVIARGPYNEYREARKKTDDPYALTEYLFRYSELGQEYIERLKTVMRRANMVKYDDYQLDPTYIKVE